MTAYHEGGHALVSWFMPHMDPVHRISIVGRSFSLGQTQFEYSDRIHETKTHLLEQITAMLGGRAAEQIVFKEMTTGASDDIEKATGVVRKMVMEFGMSELGPVNLDMDTQSPYEQSSLSPEMAAKVDIEIKKIIDNCYKNALSVLTKSRDKLDNIAGQLLQNETIESEEFVKLIGPKKRASAA